VDHPTLLTLVHPSKIKIEMKTQSSKAKMENVHVILPGYRKEPAVQLFAVELFNELAQKCGGWILRCFDPYHVCNHPPCYDCHREILGQVIGQEIVVDCTGIKRERLKVWRSDHHIGGYGQICCNMEVPDADQAVHYADELGFELSVFLLKPKRDEGAQLRPRAWTKDAAGVKMGHAQERGLERAGTVRRVLKRGSP
jgi:hypothetical protein